MSLLTSGATGFRAAHKFQAAAVCVLQAVFDEGNRELRHVYADPVPAILLRCVNRRAATAEGVEHEVAGIAAGLDDSLQQCHGLLRWISEAFGGCVSDSLNIRPNVNDWFPFFLVQEHFPSVETWSAVFLFQNQTFCPKRLQLFQR